MTALTRIIRLGCKVMLFMSTAHLIAQPTPTQAPFPPVYDPSLLLPANGADGSAGFVINGANGGDFLGKAVYCTQWLLSRSFNKLSAISNTTPTLMAESAMLNTGQCQSR